MADITVEARDDAFLVRVDEGPTESTHTVTISDEDYERLGSGYSSKEAFLEACFEFLLDREPKESILSSFDVAVISRYFPEFEDEIRR
ncbi:MAG TPA: hypothetical protein VMP42_09840 [Actinomycetota bacterium]|nr:hypothetical protein [Actinomycetota bacterium]